MSCTIPTISNFIRSTTIPFNYSSPPTYVMHKNPRKLARDEGFVPFAENILNDFFLRVFLINVTVEIAQYVALSYEANEHAWLVCKVIGSLIIRYLFPRFLVRERINIKFFSLLFWVLTCFRSYAESI